MPGTLPTSANEFIEQQLDERLRQLVETLQADVLGFTGPLYRGVDDLLRSSIEDLIGQKEKRECLAIILTTFGGYIEVVQRMVETVRHHYPHVIFIIPNHAFSAGTVFAMSGDQIYMDYYSRLGPIDPQVEKTDGRVVPALGYLAQWERLLRKARKGEITLVEAQLMIDGFDQAELYAYEQARELSVALLKDWLVKYKFKNWKKTEGRGLPVTKRMRSRRAAAIARTLNNTERWHSHGHGISMEVIRRDLKLKIEDLSETPDLCDRVKQYHSLLDDYMGKMAQKGVLHTLGRYVPFKVGKGVADV